MTEEIVDKARKGDFHFFVDKDKTCLNETKDEDGRTLLHNAVTSGNSPLVDYLLKNVSSNVVNEQDEEGWAPLHSAVSLGHQRIVELLLEYGADVNILTSGKRTPLHYAASKGRAAIVRILWKGGARIGAQDQLGTTPLHRAAGAGQLSVVKILVDEAKANFDFVNANHQTPLVVALESGNESVAIYLAAKGAKIPVDDDEVMPEISERLARALKDAMNGLIDVDDL